VLFAAGLAPVLLDVIRYTVGGISGGGGSGGGSGGGGGSSGGGGGGGSGRGTRFHWTSILDYNRSGAKNLTGSCVILFRLCRDSPPRAAAVAAGGGAEALAAILPLCHRPPAGGQVNHLVDALLNAACGAIAESVQGYAPRARAFAEAGALREAVALLGEWGGGDGGGVGGAGASAATLADVALAIGAMAHESVFSEVADAALFADECARVLVAALRAHGAASALAAQQIAAVIACLVAGLASARRVLICHGALLALVAAMSAHFGVPTVVGSTSAALGALARGAASLIPGGSWGTVAVPIVDVPLSPGSGEVERGESEVRAEAAGGAVADDDDAALARA
jgi:hypothetical protein